MLKSWVWWRRYEMPFKPDLGPLMSSFCSSGSTFHFILALCLEANLSGPHPCLLVSYWARWVGGRGKSWKKERMWGTSRYSFSSFLEGSPQAGSAFSLKASFGSTLPKLDPPGSRNYCFHFGLRPYVVTFSVVSNLSVLHYPFFVSLHLIYTFLFSLLIMIFRSPSLTKSYLFLPGH